MRKHGINLLAAGLLWSVAPGSAQFYNEARDKKAQDAEAAARQISNGSVFEKETANIGLLSKLQIQGQLDLARVEWMSALDSFTTWGHVRRKLVEIRRGLGKSSLPTEEARKARFAEIAAEQKLLKEALAALQGAETEDPAIVAILNNLDKGEAALKFAERLIPTDNKMTAAAFDGIAESISVAKSLYGAWKKVREAEKASAASVAGLAVPQEQLELNMLSIEINQLNQFGILAARQALESDEILKLITECEGRLANAGVSDSEEVEATLKATKDREKLYFQLDTLHMAVAASIQNTLPVRLADLRATQQEWRRSVRESASIGRNYEQIILASAQRLALYYKGGIKPGQIAQLLYNLSGLVSLPVLAAK